MREQLPVAVDRLLLSLIKVVECLIDTGGVPAPATLCIDRSIQPALRFVWRGRRLQDACSVALLLAKAG
jgi:hypothetical protein